MNFLKKLAPKSQSHSPKQQRPICSWSARPLNFQSSNKNALPPQFHRSGRALPATATAAGELFLFGGIVDYAASNDLYVISTRGLSVTLMQTSGAVTIPRAGHASALIGDDLLIWGGATNLGVKGEIRWGGSHDDSLYLLNLGTLDLLISRAALAN
jgi:hypothetical protein